MLLGVGTIGGELPDGGGLGGCEAFKSRRVLLRPCSSPAKIPARIVGDDDEQVGCLFLCSGDCERSRRRDRTPSHPGGSPPPPRPRARPIPVARVPPVAASPRLATETLAPPAHEVNGAHGSWRRQAGSCVLSHHGVGNAEDREVRPAVGSFSPLSRAASRPILFTPCAFGRRDRLAWCAQPRRDKAALPASVHSDWVDDLRAAGLCGRGALTRGAKGWAVP